MENHYHTSLEHVYDELLMVDLLINAEVIRVKTMRNGNENSLMGLYITDDEINSLLKYNSLDEQWFSRKIFSSDAYDTIKKAINVKITEIRQKTAASLSGGIRLNLSELNAFFNLSAKESLILSICLAHQIDSKYVTVFSFLQNDVTKKNPTVEFLMDLTCDSYTDKVASREIFSPQSPLFRFKLLEFVKDVPNNLEKPLLQREVRLNNRIAGYILDNQLIDDDLAKIAGFYHTEHTLQDLIISETVLEQLKNFIHYYLNETDLAKKKNIFALFGKYGPEKETVAAVICKEIGVPLLVIDIRALLNSGINFEEGIDLALRESNIIPAGIYLKNCDILLQAKDEEAFHLHYFITALDAFSWLTFIDAENSPRLHGKFYQKKYFELELSLPEYEERKKIWQRHLENTPFDPEIDIKEISGKFLLNTSQIREAVYTASTIALWRTPEKPFILKEDLIKACHLHSSQRLKDLAVRINPRYQWKDIVLPLNLVNSLREIVNMVKYRHIVYDEWGFNQKLTLGKGICALFFGEPGTGKTMACDIIANELNMELYKIDISTVVSKYIGETEKNLNKIFTEAETSNAVLFFDEADALFGKRTEVKDSHDRYSNIEISYLLQKIDEYTGIVIMATNFYQNIDDAFERRIHFILNFPPPDEPSRLNIWNHIFPKTAPLDSSIDFALLARRIKVNGGNIKNIALSAAFYAAESGSGITMNHIIRACKKEYEKIGLLWDDKLN